METNTTNPEKGTLSEGVTETQTISLEPQWSGMTSYFKQNGDTESLQAILNLYQGFRDFTRRLDTKYATAFAEAMAEATFKVEDMEGNN